MKNQKKKVKKKKNVIDVGKKLLEKQINKLKKVHKYAPININT